MPSLFIARGCTARTKKSGYIIALMYMSTSLSPSLSLSWPGPSHPFPPPSLSCKHIILLYTLALTYTGPGGWNDADFIYTGGQGCSDDKPLIHCPGQTDTEYRTEFSMWCIIGSSLIVATDIRNMTDIMKEVRMCKT